MRNLIASLLGGSKAQGLDASDLEARLAAGTDRGFEMPAAPVQNLHASIMGGAKAQGLNGADLEARLADGTARGFEMPVAPKRSFAASILGGSKGQGPSGLALEEIFADKQESDLAKPVSDMVSAVLSLAAEAMGERSIDSMKLEKMHQEIVSAVMEGRAKGQGLSGQELEEKLMHSPATRQEMISAALMLSAAETDQLEDVKRLEAGVYDSSRQEMVSAALTLDGAGELGAMGARRSFKPRKGAKRNIVHGLIVEEKLAEQVAEKPSLAAEPPVTGMVSAMLMLDGPSAGHYAGPLGQFASAKTTVQDKMVQGIIEEKLAAKPVEEARPWRRWLNSMVSAVLMLDDGKEHADVTRVDSAQLEAGEATAKEVRLDIASASFSAHSLALNEMDEEARI